MRIYYSLNQTPMLLDSLEAMHGLHKRLEGFIASDDASIKLEAELWGSADPYGELLCGLEIQKSHGPIVLTLTPTKWLYLTGSTENLARYIAHFRFKSDDDHHHPEVAWDSDYISSDSMDLIIETSSGWIEELRGRRH